MRGGDRERTLRRKLFTLAAGASLVLQVAVWLVGINLRYDQVNYVSYVQANTPVKG